MKLLHNYIKQSNAFGQERCENGERKPPNKEAVTKIVAEMNKAIEAAEDNEQREKAPCIRK